MIDALHDAVKFSCDKAYPIRQIYMKHRKEREEMKKFISVLLALVMALSLVSVSAFATTLTINEPDKMANAEYAGYKILNATNNADNHKLFAYTVNSKYENILKSVTNKATEAEIVAYIAALDADGMRTFANNVYAAIQAAGIEADASLATGANNDVDEGYWLIAQTSAASDGETQSLVMIDTAGKDSLEIHAKKDTVTVKKEVTDESQLTCKEDHQHTAVCYDWTKTNESPIGATVKYKIETAVPAFMDGYKYNAYFIVGDILDAGLTLNKNSIVVTIDGSDANAGTDYTVKFAPDCAAGYTFQVALVNPKAHADKAVVVEYSAVVNENAKLVLTGNPNEADVTYNPTDDVKYGGEPSEDGFPTERYEKPTGHTPKDFTITYVTGVKFLKVDENNKPLAGAEFTVTGDIAETVGMKWEQKYTKVAEGEKGTYYLLNDGSYTTQAPVEKDTMVDVESTTYVGGYVKATAEDPEVSTDVMVNSIRYRESVESDFGKVPIYTLVKANAAKYAETSPNYTYSEGWTKLDAGTKHIEVVLKVDENGMVKLPGLANGTYCVVETKVPEGYNKIDDFNIVVEWIEPTSEELVKGLNAQCDWTVTAAGTVIPACNSEYLYEVRVVNQAGTELPSTGGVGTTLFYVFGGILVTAAAVLFVTKKRMSIEK